MWYIDSRKQLRLSILTKGNFVKGMTETKTEFDDIPSIENLTIDWDYEPESALGKRAWVRIEKSDLLSLLAGKDIPVKIVTRNVDKTGYLIDISVGGLAVILDLKLTEGQLVKIGLFLGKQKVISKAIVRNVSSLKGKHRIGMEFVDLEKEISAFIAGLISSKMYEI